ncbi:MAG: c-type cytochrome [Gallionellaceae bacterium]|nr:c-type cytochrome [Gallionellaceae bacterium]
MVSSFFYRFSQNTNTLLASAFIAVLLASVSPGAAAGPSQPGQQLYMVHCSGCHGTYGVSVVPDAKNFTRFDLITQPDQNLLELIRSGRNMMPGYLGILSDQEIMNIINHIRTFN